jgi:hypothetical protein
MWTHQFTKYFQLRYDPLTEMNTRNIPILPAHTADDLTTICEPIV